MGNGMTCSTTKNHGGAVVEQVEQKAGLLHCSTTTPSKEGGGVVEQSGAAGLRWSAVEQLGAENDWRGEHLIRGSRATPEQRMSENNALKAKLSGAGSAMRKQITRDCGLKKAAKRRAKG